MKSINLPPIYLAFIHSLNLQRIKYLLVGGYAVQYHGYIRQTRDLDIWTATGRDNAIKITLLIQSYGVDDPLITPALLQNPNRIIQVEFQQLSLKVLDPVIGRKPDVLTEIQGNGSLTVEILTVQSGLNFNECFAGRVVDKIGGVKVNIISLRHLKMIKQAGNRPKDLSDLQHLP